MTLAKAELIQSSIGEIVAHLVHMELTCKESFFGTSDLLRALTELKLYLDRIKARELKLQLEDYRMIIEFENFHTQQLTFSMVEAGGLFVCVDGNLYQKSYDADDDEKEFAWMICDAEGKPQGQSITFYSDEKIDRILPKIKRISF